MKGYEIELEDKGQDFTRLRTNIKLPFKNRVRSKF